MEYLHINFMVNETYLDLPSARVLPDAYRDTVRRYAVNEDCMQENAPGVMTFFTARAEDRPAVTFFSRTDRHTTTVSVGRFSQCLGWEWGEKGPSEEFAQILNADFYSEAELNLMAASNTRVQPPEKKRSADLQVNLAPQAKKAILTAAMLRWLRSDPVVRIAVPKGVDYDGYVIAAMKQIYALCPLGLQAVAGFCSYMPDPEKAIDQVYFGFIPQEMADTKTLFLDDSSQSALAAFADGTRRDGLDRFINYLCSCDENELQEFLTELRSDVEGKGNPDKVFTLGTRNYQAIGDALRIMSIQGSPEEHLKEWQSFYENISRYTLNMQNRIKKHIAQTVDTAAVAQLYLRDLKGDTDPVTVLRALRTYNALCGDCPALADALWNTAVAHLQEASVPAAKISEAAGSLENTLGNLITSQRLSGLYFLTVQSRLNKLLAEEPQETAAVVALSEKLEKLEKELQEKQPAGYEALLEQLQAKRAGLQEQQGDIAFMSLCKQLADLEKRPVENLSQIQDALTRAKLLIQRLAAQPQDERVVQLTQKVKAFQKQLTDLENSSFTDLNEILSAVSAAGDSYFTALSNIDLTRLRKLDSNQYQQAMEALDAKRPACMGAYTAAFEKSGQKLTLPVLAKKNEFVLSRIMSDLARFNCMAIPFEPRLDEKVWEKKLVRAKLLAREIFGQEKGQESVAITLDGADYEYNFFMDLLNKRLRPDAVTDDSQKQALENATMSLISAEVFRDAKALDYLTKLFANCRMSFQKLFLCILMGALGTDPKANTNAFSLMVKAAAKRHGQTEADSARVMAQLADEAADLDPKVEKQFRAFAEKLLGRPGR